MKVEKRTCRQIEGGGNGIFIAYLQEIAGGDFFAPPTWKSNDYPASS